MANHKTFEQRHLRSLDKASADQPAREEREFFGAPRMWHVTYISALLVRSGAGWHRGWSRMRTDGSKLVRWIGSLRGSSRHGSWPACSARGSIRKEKPVQLGGSWRRVFRVRLEMWHQRTTSNRDTISAVSVRPRQVCGWAHSQPRRVFAEHRPGLQPPA